MFPLNLKLQCKANNIPDPLCTRTIIYQMFCILNFICTYFAIFCLTNFPLAQIIISTYEIIQNLIVKFSNISVQIEPVISKSLASIL